MALTYSEIVTNLNAVEDTLATSTQQFTTAQQRFSSIVTAMDKIGTDTPTTVADAQALLAGDPSNAKLLSLIARIDLLFRDRATLNTRAQAAESAAGGI